MAKSKCSYKGCESKRSIVDGYCRVHSWRLDPPKSPPLQGVKNREISSTIEEMQAKINGLQRETLKLTNQLELTNQQLAEERQKIEKLEIENGELELELS